MSALLGRPLHACQVAVSVLGVPLLILPGFVDTAFNCVRPVREHFLAHLLVNPIEQALVDGDSYLGLRHEMRNEYDKVVLSMGYDIVIPRQHAFGSRGSALWEAMYSSEKMAEDCGLST